MIENPYASWPPGLYEFANAYELSDEIAQELADVWGTIRVRRPQTSEEWARIWEFVGKLTDEGSELWLEVHS